MAGSDNSDITTNTNHVIGTLLGEHNKLLRTETDVK